MKDKNDLVTGWLRKANSDKIAMKASLNAGSFDTACFHAHQTIEKTLKAFLIYSDLEFPFTHNLVKLVRICMEKDQSFQSLIPLVTPLIPYAVELRYDEEFWPSFEEANAALESVHEIQDFILRHFPDEMNKS